MLAGLESPSQGEPGSELAGAVPPSTPRWSACGAQAALFCPKPDLQPYPGAQDPSGEDGPLLASEDNEPPGGGERLCRKLVSSWALPGTHLFTRETRRVKSSL